MWCFVMRKTYTWFSQEVLRALRYTPCEPEHCADALVAEGDGAGGDRVVKGGEGVGAGGEGVGAGGEGVGAGGAGVGAGREGAAR